MNIEDNRLYIGGLISDHELLADKRPTVRCNHKYITVNLHNVCSGPFVSGYRQLLHLLKPLAT